LVEQKKWIQVGISPFIAFGVLLLQFLLYVQTGCGNKLLFIMVQFTSLAFYEKCCSKNIPSTWTCLSYAKNDECIKELLEWNKLSSNSSFLQTLGAGFPRYLRELCIIFSKNNKHWKTRNNYLGLSCLLLSKNTESTDNHWK
jgi:hypothetical protein